MPADEETHFPPDAPGQADREWQVILGQTFLPAENRPTFHIREPARGSQSRFRFAAMEPSFPVSPDFGNRLPSFRRIYCATMGEAQRNRPGPQKLRTKSRQPLPSTEGNCLPRVCARSRLG